MKHINRFASFLTTVAVVTLTAVPAWGFYAVRASYVESARTARWATHSHEVLTAITRLRAALYATRLDAVLADTDADIAQPTRNFDWVLMAVAHLTQDNPRQQVLAAALREEADSRGVGPHSDATVDAMLAEERRVMLFRVAEQEEAMFRLVVAVTAAASAVSIVSFIFGASWVERRRRKDLAAFMSDIPADSK